jgi:hypothetical protein
VISTFFKIPVSAVLEKEALRQDYMQHRQEEGTGMRSFVSKDNVLFEKYERGGGQVTDQTRIEWVEQKISPASSLAMADHRKMMKGLGKQDPALCTDWFKYSDALIMVCSDLTAVQAPTQEPAQAPAAPVQQEKPFLAPRPSGGRQLTKPQLQAIHRYAAAHGESFSNVSLEEVEGSEGGVGKWTNIPQKTAEDMFKAQDGQADEKSSQPKFPRMFPVVKKRDIQLRIREPFICSMLKLRG